MKQKFAVPVFLSLLILVSGCVSGPDLTSGQQPEQPQESEPQYSVGTIQITASRVEQVTIATPSGSVSVSAEIANTPERWQRGLMFRTSLEENSGMLFVFDAEQPQTFWMKDTLIPLDIIFISSSGRIVDITTMQPCQSEPCPTYTSSQPALYALEVNAGFADANGIEAGNSAVIPQV